MIKMSEDVSNSNLIYTKLYIQKQMIYSGNSIYRSGSGLADVAAIHEWPLKDN